MIKREKKGNFQCSVTSGKLRQNGNLRDVEQMRLGVWGNETRNLIYYFSFEQSFQNLAQKPLMVNMAIQTDSSKLRVIYASESGKNSMGSLLLDLRYLCTLVCSSFAIPSSEIQLGVSHISIFAGNIKSTQQLSNFKVHEFSSSTKFISVTYIQPICAGEVQYYTSTII